MSKRITTLILAVSLFLQVFVITSCNRRYDEDEVIEATKVLLKNAEKLNFIYYGEGLKYQEDENAKGYYRKADKTHLDELGFHTIDELKSLTEATFSDDYSGILYSNFLNALMSNGTLVSATRYYQAYDEKTGQATDIMVHSKYEPMMNSTITYDYDSISVEKSKKKKVYATVDATVTDKDGNSKKVKITITLIEEDDGWKIDNPVYANYI